MTRSHIPAHIRTAIIDMAREFPSYDQPTQAAVMIAAARLEGCAQIAPGALDRMADALGWPVGSRPLDSDGGGPTLDENGHPMPTISDPTGEAAIRPDLVTHDRTVLVATVAELVRAVDTFTADPTRHTAHLVLAAADLLLSSLERWAPRHAHDGDRTRGDDVPLCESCARLTDHRGRALAEPAERNKGRYQRRTVAGTPRWLCAPCGNFAKANERMPTKDELARFRDTGRWRVRAA